MRDFNIVMSVITFLCDLSACSDTDTSTQDAHQKFMSSYKTMFVQEQRRSGVPNHSLTRRFVPNEFAILRIHVVKKYFNHQSSDLCIASTFYIAIKFKISTYNV